MTSEPATTQFTRWPWWRRWFGARSERAAGQFLRKSGLKILARNVADQRGELDLIAWDPTTQEIAIVEVRSTASADLQRPIESINHAKQQKLTDAALRFLARHRLLGQANVRFDVLAISWPENCAPTFQHIRHAFEAVGKHQMWS